MNPIHVPFLDLPRQHEPIHREILEAVLPLLESASYIGGPAVDAFETAFSAAHDGRPAVGLKSGTAALHLALEALGVGPGDEVIVPAFTFIATAATAVRLGATPVFVDVDDATACMDPEAMEHALTSRTRVVVPVHLYGHPAPVDRICERARNHGVAVLEDCAQSHLARWNGRPTGTFGEAAAYSFYPSKNLGAAGDAGAVVGADAALVDRVRQLANHGRAGRYEHAFVGWNERLDAVQAAVLTVKLRHLEAWTEARRRAAGRYRELLTAVRPFGEPLVLPETRAGAEPVHHLYVVRHPHRDVLLETLAAGGVAAGAHYPTTLPSQPAFAKLDLPAAHCPRAEAWAASCIALPLFPGITVEQQTRVAEVLASAR